MPSNVSDYAAMLEAKRKDDEKRWQALLSLTSAGSPMGQVNQPVEAMQMLGQIGGAGGTKAAASPFPSWLNAPADGAPRPMPTPEQKKAQSAIYATAGQPETNVRGGAGEDERKRLEAVMGLYGKKAFLSPKEEAELEAIKKRWAALSGIDMPEGLSNEVEEPSTWYKPWTWKGKGSKAPSTGKLPGME